MVIAIYLLNIYLEANMNKKKTIPKKLKKPKRNQYSDKIILCNFSAHKDECKAAQGCFC